MVAFEIASEAHDMQSTLLYPYVCFVTLYVDKRPNCSRKKVCKIMLFPDVLMPPNYTWRQYLAKCFVSFVEAGRYEKESVHFTLICRD